MRTASIILLLAASVGGSIVLTQPESRPNTVRFTDITNSAHINFQHNNGASGKKYLPETLGAGCAFLDVMNQGWQDILLVNGESWPELNSGSATTLKLYRNNHNETSTDVTQAAGLSIPMYGMGVTVGDYDNDGYPDIFVTAVGHNHLFHNNGDGTFSDVTRKAGLWGDERFSTGAVWVDYDRDGYLDLFVANYVKWSPATDVFCTLDGKRKSYCNAEPYKGDSPRLYHNNRNGTFTDVTRESGVYKPTAKALGVTVVDVDGDGWPDLVLANDGEPDIFFHNNRNGTFEDAGELAGIGYAETGTPHLATGVDAADYDGSGRPSLVFTSAGRAFLYRNEGTGSFYEGRNFFLDVSESSGLASATALTMGFGVVFFDFDLDGQQDLFIADGHIDSDIQTIQPRVSYAQSPHLMRNEGNGRFRDVIDAVGPDLRRPLVARGVCYGDVNNDGHLDLLVTTNGGPAHLYRNDGGNNNSWIGFKLEGRFSNRDSIGAQVRVLSGGKTQTQTVKSGTGYLSQNQLPLVFGLGGNSTVDKVEISWPSGRRSVFGTMSIRRTHVIVESDSAPSPNDTTHGD